MRKKRQILTFLVISLHVPAIYGAAGRPKDGFLAFVLILGFLGIVLGVLHLIDLIRSLIRSFTEIRNLFRGDGGELLL